MHNLHMFLDIALRQITTIGFTHPHYPDCVGHNSEAKCDRLHTYLVLKIYLHITLTSIAPICSV